MNLDLTIVVAAQNADDELARACAVFLGPACEAQEIVLVGQAAAQDWRALLPESAGACVKPLPMSFESTDEAFAAGLAMASGRWVAFAEPQDARRLRRFNAAIAAIAETPGAVGMCFKAPKPKAQAPDSWVRQAHASAGTIRDLLAGRFDLSSLIVNRPMLATAIGEAPASSAHFCFDLALRLALAGCLATANEAALATHAPHAAPKAADELLSRRLAEITARRPLPLRAATILELRDAVTSGAWPSSCKTLAAITDDFIQQSRVSVFRAEPDERRRSLEMCRKLAAKDDDFVMVVTDAAPARARVEAQLLRMEASGLVACLAVVDDGLFHQASGPTLIPATLFRRAALAQALARIEGEAADDEAVFWQALASIGAIDGLEAASPCRDDEQTPLSVDRAAGDEIPTKMLDAAAATLFAEDAKSLRRGVDAAWYLETYPDVAAAGVSAVAHYQQWGCAEGRDPNPWFATAWYREKYGIVADGPAPELTHFLREGAVLGQWPHPKVDLNYYAWRYLGEPPGARAFFHLIETWRTTDPVVMPDGGRRPLSASEMRLIEQLVDSAWYLDAYPDVAAAGCRASEHYLRWGWAEGRNPNARFATAWYRQAHKIDGEEAAPELTHFVRIGARRGLKPHPDVDLAAYARSHLHEGPSAYALLHMLGLTPTDESAAVVEPQDPGQPDGDDRLRAALVDADWYLHAYPDVAQAGADPVEHYMMWGWTEGRDPNPWFSTLWYRSENSIDDKTPAPELTHFIDAGAERGLKPHPDIDLAAYARHYLDEKPSARAFLHLVDGWRHNRTLPSPLIDNPLVVTFLATQRPQDRALHAARLIRSALQDRSEPALVASVVPPDGVRLVDSDWCRAEWRTALADGETPSDHYATIGWRNGLDPNAAFWTSWYIDNNPDAATTEGGPLAHYLACGAAGGALPSPMFDPVWYARRYRLEDHSAAAPLVDFVAQWRSAAMPRLPHPRFDHAAVLTRLLEVSPLQRASELRRLWRAREAFEASAVRVAASMAETSVAALLWALPDAALPGDAHAGAHSAERPGVFWKRENDAFALALDPSFTRRTFWFEAERDQAALRRLILQFDIPFER